METASDDPEIGSHRVPRTFMADFAELVKARLTLLVLVTTSVGYYMGAPSRVSYVGMLQAFVGTALAAAGAAALNQWWERSADALMHRTQSRPIPSGRMQSRTGLILGLGLSISGVVYLYRACNPPSAALAALTVLIYLLAYTPLKKISTTNTLVGAIPGALPPMIGWAATGRGIDLGAWSLFAIIFFWQLPHFFAISWMYRDDYVRGGFQMISNDDKTGERSASQSVFFCMMLLIVAGLPTFIRIATFAYLGAELILGCVFIVMAMRFLRTRTRGDARLLFLTSIIYLPLLLAALVLSKT